MGLQCNTQPSKTPTAQTSLHLHQQTACKEGCLHTNYLLGIGKINWESSSLRSDSTWRGTLALFKSYGKYEAWNKMHNAKDEQQRVEKYCYQQVPFC